MWTIASIIVFYSFFPDKDHAEKEQLNDIAEIVSDFLGLSTEVKHYILMHEWNDNPYYRELSQEEQGKLISDIESGKVEVTDFIYAKNHPRIKRNYKLNLIKYHKERRNAIYHFPLYWLAPIGLVYGSGWAVGWIIIGFRKDN